MSTTSTTNLASGTAHGLEHAPGHDPHLAHHFQSPEQQYRSAKLGMWVFLGTEILMFGGLFCAYAINRHNHPLVFSFAAQAYLNVGLGTLNTLLLISSSLTMAWGVRAAQLERRRLLITCLILTIVGGVGFLVIKAIEYQAKWDEHVWIGQWNRYNNDYNDLSPYKEAPPAQPPSAAAALPAAPEAALSPSDANKATDVSKIKPRYIGPTGLANAPGQPGALPAAEAPPASGAEIDQQRAQRYRDLSAGDQWRVSTFFSCYFLLTGLHGLHVVVGISLISWILMRSLRGDFSSRYFTPVDLVGLYWHLVDMIWIFLFPLFYLIR